jgi:PAS domain S-box-containing protein
MARALKQVAKNKQRPISQVAIAEALFVSMGDGAITTDEFGKITNVNASAEFMLGYTKKDLIGKNYIKTVKAFSFDGFNMSIIDRPVTKAFLTGKPVSGKMYYQTRTGRLIPVAVNVSPILLDGTPVGSISIIRDITMEYEVDRMKSEFISLASHQLRTPLSAIKTYAHMLADGYMGELNEEQKSSLETIVTATNRMNELISTLLNITKIESGTILVNSKKVNVKEIIEEVLPELKLIAEMKVIKLSLGFRGSASPQITSDALIIKEVITSIVSNAIKYTPENGQVDIIIKPRRNDVLVEISDTGWGIPAQAQDKVFSKFFRGQNIIKRVTSGTGLGLYLAKGLIDTLGGEIWFKSEEGKGTSFYFTLPRLSRKTPLEVKN